MVKLGIIFTTTESIEQAKSIAKTLVEEKLSACVNISGPVHSVYHWEEKLCESQEYLLIIKALESRYKEIENKIKKLHSYSNPEIIYTEIKQGSKEYLDWLVGH